MWLKAERVDLREITEIAPIQFKDIGGHKIAYRDIGSGPVVFCLPPWPFSSIAYTPFAAAMGGNLRLICLDMPGWGGHSPKLDAYPTPDKYGHLIARFIDSFNLETYSLLGWSYGGVMAQWLTDHNLAHPQKVALISTMHSGKRVVRTYSKRIRFYNICRKLYVPNFILKPIIVGIIKRSYTQDQYLNTVADTPLLKACITDTLRVDLEETVEAAMCLLNTEVNHNHAFPTQALVMYGDNDLPSIREESLDMAQSLGVVPITIDDAGHDHMFFVVNKAADVILNFMLA